MNTGIRPKRGKAQPAQPSAEIVALAADHGNRPEALIAVLQAVQARHGGITRDAVADAARALGIPVERAWRRHPSMRRAHMLVEGCGGRAR
jgi:NADH:ubiquinone oxidoreductase subunit E